MLSLTDRASLRAAALDPALDPYLSALLRRRFEQLGGTGADFHVLQPGDDRPAAEKAVGFPLTDDDEPCWEWSEAHPGGWTECVFILSDDGPAQVLLVPQNADGNIADLLRRHAAPAADQEQATMA